MLKRIMNVDELSSHGNKKGRKIVLDIVEHGIEAVDTYIATKRLVNIEGDQLTVGRRRYDLNRIRNIYVVGAGKGSFPIVNALEDILGDRIKEGVVAVKSDETRKLKKMKVITAGHPMPNKMSSVAAREIIRLASQAQRRDLVFAAITGGSSALMALPAEGISLRDTIEITKLLLKSGAAIQEINAVRKHISAISGGRLTRFIYPAKIVNLTLLTNPKGMPWPDAIFADPSTFQDAIKALKSYDLWERAPRSIKAHLIKGLEDPSMETPKDLDGAIVQTINLGDQEAACKGAAHRARELGLRSFILSLNLEGEAREIGIALAGISEEIFSFHRPFAPPCVLISAGETTVRVENAKGKGGPNQELVLSFARKIGQSGKIVIASIGTDGSDGPTEIAGGIADGFTVERARAMGLNLFDHLRYHDSSSALKQLGDAVVTGATGTNVMDLRVIFVDK